MKHRHTRCIFHYCSQYAEWLHCMKLFKAQKLGEKWCANQTPQHNHRNKCFIKTSRQCFVRDTQFEQFLQCNFVHTIPRIYSLWHVGEVMLPILYSSPSISPERNTHKCTHTHANQLENINTFIINILCNSHAIKQHKLQFCVFSVWITSMNSSIQNLIEQDQQHSR